MSAFLKAVMLVIFGLVIFGRQYVNSDALYWSLYFILFALIPLLWMSMYRVSRKKALQVLGKEELKYDVAVGMVPKKTEDDLIRGRLCIDDGQLKLICKKGNTFSVTWSAEIKDIESAGFGTVAGVRKGFTLYFKKEEVSFVSEKANKDRESFYKALGWK